MISRHDEIEKSIQFIALRVRNSSGAEKNAYKVCLNLEYRNLKAENRRLHANLERDTEMMEEDMLARNLLDSMQMFPKS